MRLNRVKITQGKREYFVMVGRQRAGRKKKEGKREKNGRLERRFDVQAIASTMPHRRWIPPKITEYGEVIEQRHDQKAENPFGRLALVGAITDAEYHLGRRFLTVVRLYREVIDSPREQAPSLMGRLSRSDYSEGDAPIPLRVRKPLDGEEAARRTRKYQEMIHAVKLDKFGKSSQRFNLIVLNSVVVHERELGPGDLPFLKAALASIEANTEKPKEQRARIA